jgi:hypothetical protein
MDVARLVVKERKVLVKAEIDNTSGAYDMLDPRDDFAFLLDDGLNQIDVVIPTLDPGWDRSKPEKGRYKWKGLVDGVKRILVKDQSEKKGRIRIKILGKEVPGADVLTTTPVTVEISLDGECVGQDLLDP